MADPNDSILISSIGSNLYSNGIGFLVTAITYGSSAIRGLHVFTFLTTGTGIYVITFCLAVAILWFVLSFQTFIPFIISVHSQSE